jgi:hypothetical protein
MQKKYHIQLICLGLSISLLAFMPRVMAQDGTLIPSGQITNSTCVVNVTKPGESALSGSTSKTLSLGNYPQSATATTFNDSALPWVVFSLSNGNGQACSTFQNSFWDLSINFKPEQVGVITQFRFEQNAIKNSIPASNGGTDLFVSLYGTVMNSLADTSNPSSFPAAKIYPVANAGPTANTASGPLAKFTAKSASAIVLGAQFALPTGKTTPNAGLFSQTLPLTLVYK